MLHFLLNTAGCADKINAQYAKCGIHDRGLLRVGLVLREKDSLGARPSQEERVW